MITDIEKAQVARIIKRIARENRVSEAQVRADMKEAMDYARSNPDPAVQREWAGFHYEGDEPTVEELSDLEYHRLFVDNYRL